MYAQYAQYAHQYSSKNQATNQQKARTANPDQRHQWPVSRPNRERT